MTTPTTQQQPAKATKVPRTYTKAMVLDLVSKHIGTTSWRTILRWQSNKDLAFPRHRLVGQNPVFPASQVDEWLSKKLTWN